MKAFQNYKEVMKHTPTAAKVKWSFDIVSKRHWLIFGVERTYF